MAKVRRGLNRAVVHFITTHPGYRGRGLGRRLIQSLQEACDEVIARGVNYDARGFWRHLEFWREGQGHDYYWRRGGSP
jgi:GNAT superfamily N-acetyltransferase